MAAAHNGRVPLTTDPQQRRRADSSPYVDLTRAQWSALREKTPLPLTADEVEQLRGLGDVIDLDEVRDVYLPLSRLLNLYVGASSNLRGALNTFLGDVGSGPQPGTPFVIGVAGSVAVGKSTTARLLQALLARWPEHPRVELVTTDGFLFPNAELHRRGLMSRKGFPESYDRRALTRFVADVKSGKAEVTAPVYSHLIYDIVPDEQLTVQRPDILIVEGLNVLEAGAARQGRPHPARARRLLRLLRLRRRPHRGHREVVPGPLPQAAPNGLPEPVLVLPQVHPGLRGRGPRLRPDDLAHRQQAQSATERRPDPRPRQPGAAQGS